MRKENRHLAFAGLVAAVSGISMPQIARTAEAGTETLQEVVVTAEKRTENLLDVPASLGVISGAQLENLNANSLQDFLGYIPGVIASNAGSPGQNMVAIRGLTSSYENNTAPSLVATYLDDHPVGSSTAAARGAMYGLDLVPYDIERVEVLRGPQGTLYGANAMGGLIRYVLRKPDVNQFDTQVGADVDYINGSGSPGYAGRGAVNLPLVSDVLAVRLSAFGQHVAGYIDNLGTGIDDANHANISGARASILWKPTGRFTVQGSFVYQDIDAADQTAVTVDGATQQPLYGWLKTSSHFPQPYTQTLRDYALNLNWEMDFATLTSISSASSIDADRGFDLTAAYGPFTPNNPDSLAQYFLSDDVKKYTEELRLVSPGNQKIQWMLGGFYTNEKAEEDSNVPTYTPTYQPLPYNLLMSVTNYEYHEAAAFGNVTFQLTDRFDLGGGVRYAHNSQSWNSDAGGVFGSGISNGSEQADVTTWSADAKYHFDAQSMAYVRVATGYRPGGANAANVPEHPTFNPDTLTNYEVGLKGEFLEHRLQTELAVFYVDWRDIQLQLLTPQGLGYEGNGGTASSAGFELSSSYLVANGLKLTATLDRTDAHLTEDAPTIGGQAGDRLPLAPLWTASLLLDYVRSIGADQNLIAGGGYTYRDAMLNQLYHTGNPYPMGPQNIVNLYVGYERNKTQVRLYAKNLFDNRSYNGLLNNPSPEAPIFVPTQPLTVGLSLDYRF